MAESPVEIEVSDDDFYGNNTPGRVAQSSKVSPKEVRQPSAVIKIQLSQTSTSNVNSGGDTDLGSGDEEQLKDPPKRPGSPSEVNYEYDFENDDGLSDEVTKKKPKKSKRKKTSSATGGKADKSRSTSKKASSESEDESDFNMIIQRERKTAPNLKSRAKSAPVKRMETKEGQLAKPQSTLENYRDLLREVLELDLRNNHRSRPPSASTSSIRTVQSRQSRQRSVIEIPYRWRQNYTFNNDRLAHIESENRRLLGRIRACPAEVNKTWNLGGQGFDKRGADEVIRARKMQEIEGQNLALLKRIRSIRPSRELRCDVLLTEYNNRQTDFLGGSGNILWTKPQQRTPPIHRPIQTQAARNQLSKLRRRTNTDEK